MSSTESASPRQCLPVPLARETGAYAKKSSTKSRGREIELDFVRGLAILLVLDYHAPVHWLSYPFHLLGFPDFGWAGVDIFFVLSGFLVGGLLIKEWRTQGNVNYKRFLARRGLKIWPQYYAFLLLMVLTGHRSLRDLTGNLLNLQNYLGGVPHTWSLAVEEHAYLLLALGLAWAAHAKLRMRTLAIVLVAICVLVVASRLILGHYGFDVVTRTHTRVEGILYGVLLAVAFHYRPAFFAKLQARRWLWVGALLAALLFLRFQPKSRWGDSLGWDAANLLGIAVLMLLYQSRQGKRPGVFYRSIAWVGVYSYGIYLWHVAVIAPAIVLAGKMPFWLNSSARAIFPIAGGIALGALFTRFVEMPVLILRDRWIPRGIGSPLERHAESSRLERTASPVAIAGAVSTAATQVAGV